MPRIKLSDKGLKGLKTPPTGPAQEDYWDTLMPGFGVRVGRGGRKSFFVGTHIHGRYRRLTLKPPYPALTLAEARDQARKIIAAAQLGVDPEATKAQARAEAMKRKRNSFAAVAADFMEDHAKNLRTRDEIQRKLNVELLPHWGDRPITSITRSDIKVLLREKARTSVAAADRLLPLISKIFAWALDEEIITASPAMRLPRQGQAVERERTLSPDEIKIVWNGFDRMGYPFGHLFKLLLLTGQRRGEVAGMRWSEIDAEGWLLPGTRSKSKVGHRVPLSTFAREVLEATPRFGDLVFTSRGDRAVGGWSKSKSRLDRLCPGVAPWRIHDLRRTTATQLRSLGVDRLVVSKLLNHAEAGVTKVYDRYAADPEKVAAMERWANRVREIVSGKPVENVVPLRARS